MATVAPVVRVTILHDGRELILGRPLPEHLAQQQQQGIQGWLAQDPYFQRPQADFKTGNYLSAWQARQRAIALGPEKQFCQIPAATGSKPPPEIYGGLNKELGTRRP